MIAALIALAVTPLLHAHAHNDYEHPHPLFDALAQGFTSVEADVYLVDGRLLVAHDRKDLKPSRSLKSLYIDPLVKRVNKDGAIYPGVEFTLMIDVKADGPAATRELVKELETYRRMISTVIPRQIKIVVSGVGDREVVAKESARLLFLDGRPADLEQPRDASIAWVSDSWDNQFKWTGVGEMPPTERAKLQEMAARAHARGYRLRFWAIPESSAVWRELQNAQVDLIGTDQLGRLRQFFTKS